MSEKCLTLGCRRPGGHGGHGPGGEQCGLCRRCYQRRYWQIRRGEATAEGLVRAGLMRFGRTGRPRKARPA